MPTLCNVRPCRAMQVQGGGGMSAAFKHSPIIQFSTHDATMAPPSLPEHEESSAFIVA